MVHGIKWTNPSVKLLAKDNNPVDAIVEKTRELILEAMDDGWHGPPYDPSTLAEYLGLTVTPNEEVFDARLVPKSNNSQIEYNPSRSKTRIRFSIAHEIGHFLFPDYKKSIHHRSGKHQRTDDWQLELLCNVAVAEILMPVGPFSNLEYLTITMDNVLEIQKKYNVSIEAVLLRLVKLTTQPITLFSAARKDDGPNSPFRIDYVVSSPTSSLNLHEGLEIPASSVLSECTAVGFTAIKKEKLFNELSPLEIECVGIAPYHGMIYPRVLGIIKTKNKKSIEPVSINYLRGDALQPRGDGHKIIVHIANDKSKKWGRGFGFNISKKWPNLKTSFSKWANQQNLELGNCHIFSASDDCTIISMVAQKGFGNSLRPRIRYQSLAACLERVAVEAQRLSATVHMPRIGVGFAGGNWDIIRELVDELLVKKGIEVTVYDLPGYEKPRVNHSLLDFNVEDIVTN